MKSNLWTPLLVLGDLGIVILVYPILWFVELVEKHTPHGNHEKHANIKNKKEKKMVYSRITLDKVG